MKIKLKNVLIVSVILFGLVLNSRVLGNPGEDCGGIKAQIDALVIEIEKCGNLPDEEQILNCTWEASKEISKLTAKLNECASELEGRLIELREDIQNLNNQISYLNAKIEKTELEVVLKEEEIHLLEIDISNIEKEIKKKEKETEEMKKRIAETIKSLYEYDSHNLVTLTLTQGTLSDFFDEVVYVSNLQSSIGEALEKLKADKKILELNKEALKERQESIAQTKNELDTQVSRLNEDKQNKATLLEITGGDEKKFQEILDNINSQKREVFRLKERVKQIQRDASAEWWYYDQGNYFNVIPNCYYYDNGVIKKCTIASHGCAITSVAMVYTFHGHKKTPPQVLNEADFDGVGNIYWPSPFKRSNHCNGCANWTEIDKRIGKGNPVIVFIRVSGNAGHYVVVYKKEGSKYLINDPWFGSGIYLDATLSELGVSKNNIDQMVTYGD